MVNQVQCAGCGAKFQAPERLAGKRVKCPKCSAAVLVTNETRRPSGEAISADQQAAVIPVACRCGKKLRVKAELAGKRVKCPACGGVLVVPDPRSGLDPEPDGLPDLDSLTDAETGATMLPRQPLRPATKKADALRTRVIIGLSAGAGGVLLVLLLALIFWPSGGGDQIAGHSEAAGTESPDMGGGSPEGSVAGSGESAAAWPAADANRTYPSFPDAVTQAPSWLKGDAPFDVAEFFEAPPSEENAAPLYLDAMFEFSGEFSICFAPAGAKPQGEVLRRVETARRRIDEYVRFEEAWEKNPKAVDEAAVGAWLAQYETGFQKLAEAQRRPQCVFETGVGIAALLPHTQSRQVVRVVKWRARRDLAKGNIDRPIQNVELVLRLSRDIQPRGGVICQLVSVAVDDLCCGEIITQILRADGIEQAHCDRLMAELTRHETVSQRRFAEGMQMEYLMARKSFHDFQHHTGDFSPQGMKNMGWRGRADTPLARLRLLIRLGGGSYGRLAKEKYGEWAYGEWAGAARLSPDHPLVAGWTHNGKLLSDADYAKEVSALNSVYASILSTADQPAMERLQASTDAAIIEPLRDTKLALLFEPSVAQNWQKALLRADATLRGTRCLIALRRWQIDHDGPPPDLETIVKAAGMQGIPADPYTGRPLQMTTIDGEPVIYSVAMDGKDDRGRVDVWKSAQPGKIGDLLFRLNGPQ